MRGILCSIDLTLNSPVSVCFGILFIVPVAAGNLVGPSSSAAGVEPSICVLQELADKKNKSG